MYATARRKAGTPTDANRLRIQPLPDMLLSAVTTRDVLPTVNDPLIRSLHWELREPGGRSVTDEDTGREGWFTIEPAHITAPGVYHLTCTGLDPDDAPRVESVRDFRIIERDRAAAAVGMSGVLKFTRYDKVDAPTAADRYHVETELQFRPSPWTRCHQIGWLQTSQVLGGAGMPMLRNVAGAEVDARQTPLAWTIDRVSGAPSPFYGTKRDPQLNVDMQPGFGHFGVAGRPAVLQDWPEFEGEAAFRYESCAVCRAEPDRGDVYGCATWGFTADNQGKVTLLPRDYSAMPSAEFRQAHAAWNEWRATLPPTDVRESAPELSAPERWP